MESIYEKLGGTYQQTGDYLFPTVNCPENANVGIWGQRRERHLRTKRKVLYFNLLTTGKLKDHLEEIDKSASEMFEWLVSEMNLSEGLTECLKAEDPLEWVRRMNNIRNRAEEIVYKELIFA